MSDRDNKPRGIPPKTLKAGAPPKLGGVRSNEVNSKPPVALTRQPSALETKQPPTLNGAENSPAVPPRAGTRALPIRGALRGGIIGKPEKLKAERRRSQWPLLLFALAVLSALVIVPFLVLRPQNTVYVLRQFTAATVTNSTIEETVSSSGTVAPKDVVDVNAKVAATVKALPVKEGQDVIAGQVLVKLASPDLEQSLRDAEKTVSKNADALAQARLSAQQSEREADAKLGDTRQSAENLKLELTRLESLYALGGEARINVDAARQKLAAAQRSADNLALALRDARAAGRLSVEIAQRNLTDAQQDLKRTAAKLENLSVRASFAGRVVALPIRVGQDVVVSAKLLTLADLSQLIVDSSVDALSAARVQPGQAVRIRVGNQAFSGKVARVAAQAVKTANGSTVNVTVRLLSSDQATGATTPLRPNSGASLEITVGRRRDVPTLPRGAFITTGGERIAYVLAIDGSATRTDVSFGASNANLIEITSGLSAGTRVITSSVEAFKDQARIEVSAGGELR